MICKFLWSRCPGQLSTSSGLCVKILLSVSELFVHLEQSLAFVLYLLIGFISLYVFTYSRHLAGIFYLLECGSQMFKYYISYAAKR